MVLIWLYVRQRYYVCCDWLSETTVRGTLWFTRNWYGFLVGFTLLFVVHQESHRLRTILRRQRAYCRRDLAPCIIKATDRGHTSAAGCVDFGSIRFPEIWRMVDEEGPYADNFEVGGSIEIIVKGKILLPFIYTMWALQATIKDERATVTASRQMSFSPIGCMGRSFSRWLLENLRRWLHFQHTLFAWVLTSNDGRGMRLWV